MQREAQRAKAMGGVLEGELPPPHQLGDLGERYKLSSVVWGEARAKGIFGVFWSPGNSNFCHKLGTLLFHLQSAQLGRFFPYPSHLMQQLAGSIAGGLTPSAPVDGCLACIDMVGGSIVMLWSNLEGDSQLADCRTEEQGDTGEPTGDVPVCGSRSAWAAHGRCVNHLM